MHLLRLAFCGYMFAAMFISALTFENSWGSSFGSPTPTPTPSPTPTPTPPSIWSSPAPLNSDAATDNRGNLLPAMATDGKGLWIAVWSAPGNNSNPYDDAVTADGKNDDLYYARSLDDGKTWSAQALLKTNSATDNGDDFDTDIETDRQGNWIVIWRSRDSLNGTIGYDADILCARSNDNGLTWSPPAPVNNNATSDPGGVSSGDPGSLEFAPQLAQDGQGHWVAVWSVVDNRTGSWICSTMAATSSDNGAHWSNPVPLQQINFYAEALSSIDTDGQGHWIVVWDFPNTSGKTEIYYSISNNNGTNWSAPAFINSNGASDFFEDNFPSVETDGKGNWMVVWTSRNTLGGTIGSDWDLLYSRSSNNGAAWSAPAPLNTNTPSDSRNDWRPKLIADRNGTWMTVWVSAAANWNLLYAVSENAGANWSDPLPVNPSFYSESLIFSDAKWKGISAATSGNGRWLVNWIARGEMNGTLGTDSDVFYSYSILNPSAPQFASATLSDLDALNNPDPEWTNGRTVKVQLTGVVGNPTEVQIDEDANFSAHPLGYAGTEYNYAFKTATNEIKTVYVRLRNANGASNVTSDTIGLDTVSPAAPQAPTDGGVFSLVPQVTLQWNAPADPAPGSGIASYFGQFGSAPGSGDLFYGDLGNTLTKTISALPGTTVYGRVLAIDRAGNTSDWSPASDGIFIDTPPNRPTVSISPAEPRSYQDIFATAASTDTDAGDQVNSYQYEWYRNGSLQVNGPKLPASLTERGQTWELRAFALDSYGARSDAGVIPFTIQNSPPSQPFVRILPLNPKAQQDMVVDLISPGLDPDGDEIAYDTKWFVSTDQGQTWSEKVAVRHLTQVNGLYVNEGETWRVEYIPYETLSGTTRVEGSAGFDQVYVGNNQRPAFGFEAAIGVEASGAFNLYIQWHYSDNDGDPCTVDLYWVDGSYPDLRPLKSNIPAGNGAQTGSAPLPADRPSYIHAVVRDSKGAMTQIRSAAIELRKNAADEDWVLYD